MPDSRTPFYIVYTFVAVAYSGYALSIWLRARRMRERMQSRRNHRSVGAE
jgi:hypothetical protein